MHYYNTRLLNAFLKKKKRKTANTSQIAAREKSSL